MLRRPPWLRGESAALPGGLASEDDFLDGQRIDPATDGQPDSRPDVRENAPQLGSLTADFDFSQAPRAGAVLSTTPPTDLH